MIITLMNADFSNNMIDRLNSYRAVYANVGYNISNTLAYIVKDEPYSATLSMWGGRSFVSALITMGGVDITSSCLVWDDEDKYNGSINIASVTGPIVITIISEEVARNYIDFNNMHWGIRYSPGGGNIVGASGTKYGLMVIPDLEAGATYELKLPGASFTGAFFDHIPTSGSKQSAAFEGAYGSGTFTVPDVPNTILALNIATVEAAPDNTPVELTPTAAWQQATLYKIS